MLDFNGLYKMANEMLEAYGLKDFVQIMIDYQPSMYKYRSRILFINQDVEFAAAIYISALYDVLCQSDIKLELDSLTVYKFVILHEIGHAFQHRFFAKDFEEGFKHARLHLYDSGKNIKEKNELYRLEPREMFADNFALDHIAEWL